MIGQGGLSPSLNEVETLGAKAARGAGLAWGIAEDLGRGARWLAAHDLDWAGPLLALLRDEAASARLPALLHLADRLSSGLSLDARVEADAIWAVALLAAARRDLVMAARGRHIVLSATGEVSSDRPWDDFGVLRREALDVATREGAACLPFPLVRAAGRRPVDEDLWQALDRFAQRTYVPASAQSRAAGAGGGRVDDE